MGSHNIRLCKCPPPTPPSVPQEAQFMFLFRIISSTLSGLCSMIWLCIYRDTGGVQCLQIPRKARVIHCHAQCFARLRACASVLFSPPDNLFKPRDRAISGKEMPLRSKQWVTSLSPPQPSSACFFPVCMQILYLSPVLFRHVKGRRKTVISILNKKPSFLFSCQDLSFNYHPPSRPSAILSRVFLPVGSIYCSEKNVGLRFDIIPKCKPVSQQHEFESVFFGFFFAVLQVSLSWRGGAGTVGCWRGAVVNLH